MKKGLLLIAVTGMMFASCKKCKDCTSVTTMDGVEMGTTTVEVCGKNSDFEEAEGTVTTTTGDITTTITTTCK